MKLFRKKNASHLLPKVADIAHVDQGNSYVVIQTSSKGSNAGIEVRIKLSDFGKSEAMAKHLKKIDQSLAVMHGRLIEQDVEIADLKKAIVPVEVPVEAEKPVVVKKKARAKKKNKE